MSAAGRRPVPIGGPRSAAGINNGNKDSTANCRGAAWMEGHNLTRRRAQDDGEQRQSQRNEGHFPRRKHNSHLELLQRLYVCLSF